MEMKHEIPKQFTGKQLDYSRTIVLPSPIRAEERFQKIRHRLMDVNAWHKVAKVPSAKFNIVNDKNQIQERTVREGDHIRIDIPGPGLPSADGYDWVRVEKIDTIKTGAEQQLVLTLRPCSDPTGDHTDTAHFFTRLATSTFLVKLTGRQVVVRYAGRNEVINTDNIAAWDNFRNFLIGLAAKLGASFPQWKGLVDGLSDEQRDT